MSIISKLKIFHILYGVGVFFTSFYIYGGIEFAIFAKQHWGTYFFDFKEQLGYIYALASPFVLAYHIQIGSSSKNRTISKWRYVYILTRIFRVIYLFTIALLPLVFTIVAVAFFFNEFNIKNHPIDLEPILMLLAGTFSLLSTFFIIWMTWRYK
jgi:hypothetical protein